jgi:hypothetical protein
MHIDDDFYNFYVSFYVDDNGYIAPLVGRHPAGSRPTATSDGRRPGHVPVAPPTPHHADVIGDAPGL